jgi:hypothetical protein
MYDSFIRYQSRLIRVFDSLVDPYGFEVIDATRPPVEVFESLKTSFSRIFEPQEKPKAAQRRKSVQGVHVPPVIKATARGD